MILLFDSLISISLYSEIFFAIFERFPLIFATDLENIPHVSTLTTIIFTKFEVNMTIHSILAADTYTWPWPLTFSPEQLSYMAGHVTIFGISDPYLPIYYTTFIGVRRQWRVVYSQACPLTSPLTASISSTFSVKRPRPFDIEQLSYMVRHVTDPATKFEDPMTIRSCVTIYNGSHLLPLKTGTRPLRMRRITWPVGRGWKTSTFLESLTPICLFTIQLWWLYDEYN